MDDLIERLRALSRHAHSDFTIGDEAADRIAALERELAEARKDAARYRWLRSDVSTGDIDLGVFQVAWSKVSNIPTTYRLLTEEHADTAIDAAIAAASG